MPAISNRPLSPHFTLRSHSAGIEALEARIAPAKLFAVDDANHLLSFDSATPGTISLNVNITGLAGGEFIQGLDVRPATGQLYGLGITDNGATRTGRLYTINATTGAATAVGSAFSTTLADSGLWGFDFNPVADRIRIVERTTDTNLRVHPDTGALAGTDTLLSPGAIDAVAYDRNEGGTGLTTLYGLDFTTDQLVTIGGIDGNPSPNLGAVLQIGNTGIVSNGNLNFDIESGTGIARAAFAAGAVRNLYTINLGTGIATLVGAIGNGAIPIVGFTTASTTLAVVGTASSDTLVLTATGPAAGSYSLNGGPVVTFTGNTFFSFLGGLGNDTFTIINPAGTVFAPSGGIVYDGQTHAGGNGDMLVLQGGGGASFISTFTAGAPDAGTQVTTNGGTVQTINVKGLETLVDAASGAQFLIDLPNAPQTLDLLNGVLPNTAILTDGLVGLVIDVGFANKSTVKIDGGSGGDLFTLNNPGSATGLVTLEVDGNGGTDTVHVLAVASGVTANIDVAVGVPDRIVLGGTFAAFNTGTGSLAGILGNLKLDDTGGVGEVYVDASASVTNEVVTQIKTQSGFQFTLASLPGVFDYTTNILAFQIATGSGSDTFNFADLGNNAVYSFFGGTGTDTLSVTNTSNGNDNYVLTAASVTRNGFALTNLQGIEGLSFQKSGTGNDTFDATAMPFGVSILSGDGNDTIRGSAFNDTFDGGDGFDTYVASGVTGNVVVKNSGITSTALGNDVFVLNGTKSTIEHVSITGTSGANRFDAVAFGGTAFFAGEGGADIVLGAEYKIVGTTAILPDIDGDIITLKLTKGSLTLSNFDLVTLPAPGGFALRELKLNSDAFSGTNVTLSAKPTVAGGDGYINLGYLNATGRDIGVVKIDGDLGQIDAGNGDLTKPGVASLIVHSLGELGLNTQNPGTPSLISNVAGLGALTVKTNFTGASLLVGGKLGVVKIGGNLDGGTITVAGTANPASSALALAIKAITVGGSVLQSQILVGYSDATTAVNADVQIGPVTVRGNWVASNLVAGVNATDGLFGNDDDALIAAPNAIFAKIARVLIAGQAYGTFGGVDHFGIVAERLGAVTIGKGKLKILPNATDNFLLPLTGDFRVREIV